MNNGEKIIIEGASQNNLKNIDVEIPKNKLVVFTGVSGSGKSSLAFDTLYAEGYRRYVENLSSFARFFLHEAKKPKVKKIENLSPAIAIDQKINAQNPRSTVGTLTDIYDFLRILFANVGEIYCPECNLKMQRQTMDEIIGKLKKMEHGTQIAIFAGWDDETKSIREKIHSISKLGYSKVRVGDRILVIREIRDFSFDQDSKVEVLVDRMILQRHQFDEERLIDSLQTAAKISKGEVIVLVDNEQELLYKEDFHCFQCGFTLKGISAKNFSFNLPEGACEKCGGLGVVAGVDKGRIIPNKKLSLIEGAILPWSRSGGRINGDGINQHILEALARKYNFSLKQPVEKMSAEKLDKIFYGTGEDEIEIKDRDGKKRKIKFSGVVNQLEEKYQKAESSFSRNEIEKYMKVQQCPCCEGKRLKSQFLNVKVFDKTIDQLVKMELSFLLDFLSENVKMLLKNDQPYAKVAKKLLSEIISRLEPLSEIGVGYLNLDRSCQTLSGGEFQRIRLATQLYSGLSGVIYVLDEPSIGLHSRDTWKILDSFDKIMKRGNSVIVVEHDRDIMKKADYIIDLGPGAGEDGGEIIFKGTPKELLKSNTQTSLYLSNKKKFTSRKDKTPAKNKLVIKNAKENNLQNVSISIPLGKMVCVAGVSGSGKSSLVNEILAKALRKELMGSFEDPGEHGKIEGINNLSKIVIVDQSPIGRSPRSNAATYTGLFTHIRDLFAETEAAKAKRYNASYFSFNMRGGRCEYCQGEGVKKIEMHLLDDIYSTCPHCSGTRYSSKVLKVGYHGVNIADVLDMNVEYAYNFFQSHNLIREKLKTLCDVGLGYLRLGQSATELSGGEAQRIKLATELARKTNGKTLYILDEPTIGLHFSDIYKLLKVLQNLVDKGNSVIVVEHNLDVVKSSDWIIELGPEGGKNGGEIVFEGTYDKLKTAKTWTGKAVRGKQSS